MKNLEEATDIKMKESSLYKEYYKSLKNEDFKKLVTRLKLKEEVAMKYTSKLERTVKELNNCSKCKSLLECKNEVNGCVNYPKLEEDGRLRFNYVTCKYKNKQIEEDKHSSVSFLEPLEIRKASLKNVYNDDKKRIPILRFVKKFYTDYFKDNHIKGAYLHGTFGSGKSYMLAALLNELAKKDVKCVMMYFPEMLMDLKASFNDDFDDKMLLFKTCDVLLIDDIGAESVTNWSRDEILGTILQYRMDEKLPTFFTSNLTINELEEHLAETSKNIDALKAKRIIERIKQLTVDLELESDNRRK